MTRALSLTAIAPTLAFLLLAGCSPDSAAANETSDAAQPGGFDAADCDKKEAGTVTLLCDAVAPETVGCKDPGPFSNGGLYDADAGPDAATFPLGCSLVVSAKGTGSCPTGVPNQCCPLTCFCQPSPGIPDAGPRWICPV